MNLSSKILSDVTTHMKYSRYLHDQKRRETWEEIVTRNKDMHIRKFPELKEEIENAYQFVYKNKVLPSMRSMQFGGKPIEISPNRLFNCSGTAIDHWEVFSEIMFLLLGGSGVGISVQKHHVARLPEIKQLLKRNRRFLIADTIEGWADAIKVLMKAYFFGLSKPKFDFSDIREKGAPLVTSGGKAPGPQPLKDCIHHITGILDAKEPGTKLTPLECHDIVCRIADAVLAGGIRRAALISLFSIDDEEMLTSKYGNWKELHPYRQCANNSAVILRHKITKKRFMQLWERMRANGTGEPGIYFTNDKEWICNPCQPADATVLTPKGIKTIGDIQPGDEIWTGKQYSKVLDKWSTGIKDVYEYHTRAGVFIGTSNHRVVSNGRKAKVRNVNCIDISPHPSDPVELRHNSINKITYRGKEEVFDLTVEAEEHTYWTGGLLVSNCAEISFNSNSFCNLTTINVSDIEDQADLNARAAVASFIGTLQASYTDFHYLRDHWKRNTEKEALLGVSMTGIASGKIFECDIEEAAQIVVEENKRVAALIGINPATRTTCVKPEGCIVKDSLISTDKGILSLEEIGDTIGDKWQSHSINVNTDRDKSLSTFFHINKYTDTKKITTSSGLTLESTKVHKFKVLRDKKYQWLKAEDIQVGDILPYSIGEYKNYGPLKELNRVHFYKNKYIQNINNIKQPEVLNEDLAWFLGLYFADGSNHKKGIRISGNVEELKGFDKANRIMFEQFGLIGKVHRTNNKTNDKRVQLYFNSTQLIPYLEANGLSKQKSRFIEIPLAIRTSPNRVIQSFIEGYSCEDGCDKGRTRSWCTSSKRMAEQLVVVLRAIGTDCKMREMSPTNTSYGNNMKYWVQERKGRSGNVFKNRTWIREAWYDLDKEGLEHMSVDKVVSVEDSQEETFDIHVDDNKHTYLSNSYVSHNTASLIAGSSSGIHAWFSKYYIRRIRVLKTEAIYRYLKKKIPRLIEDDYFTPSTQAIISIPVEAPDGAIYTDEPALDMLERIKRMNIEWIKPGHTEGENTNNVSATVYVKENEWDQVGKWMWENRKYYNGLTILPYDGGDYKQPPHEEITKEQFEEMYKLLKEIDLKKIEEEEDNTDLKGEVACSGGSCALI